MKKINKSFRQLIRDNRGETIVEVIVAFALLSIMLVLFSQGLAAASRSDMKAMETRTAADKAMLQLQQMKIDTGITQPNRAQVTEVDNNLIYRQVYQIVEGQDVYTYVVYSSGN